MAQMQRRSQRGSFIKILLERVPSEPHFRHSLCINWLNCRQSCAWLEGDDWIQFYLEKACKLPLQIWDKRKHCRRELMSKHWDTSFLTFTNTLFSSYIDLSLPYVQYFIYCLKTSKATWPIIFPGGWFAICSSNKTS